MIRTPGKRILERKQCLEQQEEQKTSESIARSLSLAVRINSAEQKMPLSNRAKKRTTGKETK